MGGFVVIKLRWMRWAIYVAHIRGMSNAYSSLVRKVEGTIPLGRPRCRSECNIKTYLKETGLEDVDWIHHRLVLSSRLAGDELSVPIKYRIS
jgi:hypothetical protein